jgi:putative membrane protein
MWMFNGYGMGAAGWLLTALFWIALLALVVFAVLRLFPRAEPNASSRERAEDPGEILKRRLASGEIDVDTYQQLSAKVGPSSPSGRG